MRIVPDHPARLRRFKSDREVRFSAQCCSIPPHASTLLYTNAHKIYGKLDLSLMTLQGQEISNPGERNQGWILSAHNSIGIITYI